ncbi:YkyA family protein [Paenibacillus marinisediminis]
MLTIKKAVAAAVAVLSLSIVLTGCGTPAQEQLFLSFEKASAVETQVPADFEHLKQLEEKDQKQYETIINKGESDSANVQTLITNSIASLQERQQTLDSVKQQMDEGKTQFGELTGQIDKLKDDQLKQKAEQVVTAYTKRYDTFQTLHQRYSEWIKAEQAVYEELQAQETNLKSIQNAVASRNQAFLQVEELKQQFNDYTTQFNEEKKAFYQAAGIQVDKVVTSDEQSNDPNQG